MPVSIICLDEDVRYFAERFREVFSKPQYQYFVTVLLGLMLCEGTRTLSGLLRQIADSPSLAGLSRFLSEAPWEEAAVVESWLRHFREEMQSQVAAELQRERQMQPKRRGRPKAPVVTGYLIGDDSTMHKRKAKKTFSARRGTMFEGLRTATDLVVIVVTLLAFGCLVQAIVQAYGLDERTVASWRDRAGKQCQRVHQAIVEQGRAR